MRSRGWYAAGAVGFTLVGMLLAYWAAFAFWMTAHPRGEANLAAWQLWFYLRAAAAGLSWLAALLLLIRALRRPGSPQGS